MKVQILHTGKVGVANSLPFGGNHANTIKASGVFTSKKKRLWIPVSVYLIDTPHGKILFDTGWNRDMSPNGVFDRKAQIKSLGSFLLYRINQGVVEAGATADEQLASMGISPEDLDFVVISHLDCDHANGLSAFKDAKNILVSKADLDHIPHTGFVGKTRFQKKWWEGVDLQTFEWNGTEGPAGKSYDMFGDGSVVLINIPGHSEGLCAMKLTNEKGHFVLLVSDGGYATKSWTEMISSGISENKKQQIKSLRWIKQMSEDQNCIACIANHDSKIVPHTISF